MPRAKRSVQPNPMIDWALKYINELEWSVVPIIPGQKNPPVKWKEFQKRLPTEEEVRLWWGKKYRKAGIALITGRLSGVFALDFDKAVGFNKFEAQFGEMQPGWWSPV